MREKPLSRRHQLLTSVFYGKSKLIWSLLCLFSILVIPSSVTAMNCQPPVLGDLEMDDETGEMRSPMMRNGPFTYIQSDPDMDSAKFGDNSIKSFAVDFTRPATVHLQMWRRNEGAGPGDRTFTLVHDQIFSVSEAGVQDVEVNWDLRDGTVWGFSYDGTDEVPIAFYSDSRVRAMSEDSYIAGSSQLNEMHTFSQDAPQTFRIQICTERDQQLTRSNAATSSDYVCERRPTWDTAADSLTGPLTYIHGKKISTPNAILKDVEVEMVEPNFITIQVWRKDVSNYEFLLVKERSYYARSGYNLLPTNLELQFGDQWGFTYNGPSTSILSIDGSSDNSYLFDESITGVGSKRSYASISPTSTDFKISTCIESRPAASQPGYGPYTPYGPNGQYGNSWQNNYQGNNYGNNYQGSNYGNNYQGGNNWQANAQINNGGSANVNYVPNNNGVVYPLGYNPSGGATNPFFPQASATKCYCFDNGFWYSATNNATGPVTFIDSTAFTEMNANIEAFEIQTRPGSNGKMLTLQIWRPAGFGQNALSLVWEKQVTLREGYQRINLAYSVMAGDRWGFVSQDSDVPVQFYTDNSQISHEFNYPVSASTGQQIYLSSAMPSYKKFTIRPCICSFANGVIPLSNGFPYYQAPATTQQSINSATSFLSGSGFNNQINIPNLGPQQSTGSNYGMNTNFGMNSNYLMNSLSAPQSSGSSSGDCFGQIGAPGYLEVTGPYTYINFRKLPRGRIDYVEINARNSGTVSFQMWRYDSSTNKFTIIYEKPVGLAPGINRVTVETDTNDGDLMGFSYMGSGICPIQYSSQGNSNGYEEYASYSQYSTSNSVPPPMMFTTKVFNMKACMFTTSFGGNSQSFLGGNTNNNGYAFNTANNNNQNPNFGNNFQMGNGMNNLNGAFSGYSATGYNTGPGYANQNFVNSPLYSGNSQSTPSGGQINSNIMSLLTSYFTGQSNPSSNGGNNFQYSGNNLQGQQNQGLTCKNDGEAPGPFENTLFGPYTYVGDFGDISGKCVKEIQYMASRAQSEIVFFLTKSTAAGFVIQEEALSVASSTLEPTVVSVDWCLDAGDRIGFYYGGMDEVPIFFTYYWGQASELPQEIPSNGLLPNLFDTSKSFDVSICCTYGQSNYENNQMMSGYGQQQGSAPVNPNSYGNNWQQNSNYNQQSQNQFGFSASASSNYNNNNNYGYNGFNSNTNMNSMGGRPIMGTSSTSGNGYNNYYSNNGYNNNNYGSNYMGGYNAQAQQQQSGQTPYSPNYGNPSNAQATYNYQYQNGYNNNGPGYNTQQTGYDYYPSASGSFSGGYNYQQRQQRGYQNYGGYNIPLLNAQPYNFFPPNCVGSSIDTQISLKGHPGPLVYFVETPFNRAGRLSHVELEAYMPETLTIALVNFDMNGQVNIKASAQVNVFPGVNKIPQQFVDWSIQPGDMIGFISSQQLSPVTYTVNARNEPIMNFNACLEDRIYNSPTTYNNPNPAGGLITPGGMYNSNDQCSCFDNAHWPYAFEQDYGPLTYINGEDFRQLTGFIQAFEIEASTFGTITLHLWRKASPASDRLTHIWQQTVDLRAGSQRIDGITANIQDGDMWGFTYEGQGISPVNFLTDTNYFGYEIKGQNNVGVATQNVIYLSSANMAFKRFKIRPCVCTYSTPGSNFIPQSGGMAYPNPPVNNGVNFYSQNQNNYGNNNQVNQGYNTQGSTPSTYFNSGYQNQNGYGQVASMAPNYPTDNYQFCYGQLGQPGTQTKFGPYLYINFEPLPAGTIEYIEFEATTPSNITWQIWRQNEGGEFEVVYEKQTSFQTGKHSVQLMEDTEERDLIGFYYANSDQIPIKFSKFIGEQSYEDFSGTAPTLGTSIPAPDILVDQLFNYRVCMYSVANSQPIQTSSGVGGYGNNYIGQTPPYYQSGSYGMSPGFGPAPYPVPGYDYNNLYYPDPTYGINAYNPVQPYYYDNYYPNQMNNYNQYTPSYGASTTYQTNSQRYPISPNQGAYGNNGYYQNYNGYY